MIGSGNLTPNFLSTHILEHTKNFLEHTTQSSPLNRPNIQEVNEELATVAAEEITASTDQEDSSHANSTLSLNNP